MPLGIQEVHGCFVAFFHPILHPDKTLTPGVSACCFPSCAKHTEGCGAF